MKSTIDGMNEQMKQLADLQQKNLEPMRQFGGLAVEAFEQIARQNHAVMGDMLDFTVRQTSLPLSGQSMDSTISAQMSESKSFAELMNRRATEYAELVGTIGGRFRDVGAEAAANLRTA